MRHSDEHKIGQSAQQHYYLKKHHLYINSIQTDNITC